MITQHSFIPDNDVEPRVKCPSQPVARFIDGRWCWKAFNEDRYQHEPELEQALLAPLQKRTR